jgi:hypothetical protein
LPPPSWNSSPEKAELLRRQSCPLQRSRSAHTPAALFTKDESAVSLVSSRRGPPPPPPQRSSTTQLSATNTVIGSS